MPTYCLSYKSVDEPAIRKVHEITPARCKRLPDLNDCLFLGRHINCRSAVLAARNLYMDSIGCEFCCPECFSNPASDS
jgi:hypothetical protein